MGIKTKLSPSLVKLSWLALAKLGNYYTLSMKFVNCIVAGSHENAGEISVGLNLVCVPLELGGVALAPAYQAFPTTTTTNNPRKTTSPAVLSLALVMGRNIGGGRDLTSCHELYCKFR